MKIDDKNYRDGLAIKGMLTERAWVRPSLGFSYVLQVGAGALTLLSANEIVTLGEALTQYGKQRLAIDNAVEAP